MTGIELNDSIDMSAAVYGDTDKLLCHDDELEGVFLCVSVGICENAGLGGWIGCVCGYVNSPL